MVMKTEDIVKELGRLEMKGGMHQIPEALLAELIAALKPPVVVKAEAKPAATKATPKVKGAQPE